MAARVAAIGLAIGLCGSVVVERISRFQAFASTSFDAVSAAGVVVVLFAVALLAAWLPARRAGKLDPVAALRHEA
jgi:ABC-type antimicrobial peptide transport system permease subunit